MYSLCVSVLCHYHLRYVALVWNSRRLASARAAQMNVDPEAIEAARDGHDPHAEIVALIMASQGAPSSASTAAIQGP
jgi:hypothetical protein